MVIKRTPTWNVKIILATPDEVLAFRDMLSRCVVSESDAAFSVVSKYRKFFHDEDVERGIA